MSFKIPVCRVSCLVIMMILHSTTAQLDTLSIEALVHSKMEVFEQNITEKIQTKNNEVIEKQTDSVKHLINIILAGQLDIQQQLSNVTSDLQHLKSHEEQEYSDGNGFHRLQNSSKAQQEEMLKKFSDHARKTQQMDEFNMNLRSITENLVAGQLEIRKELSSVKKKLNDFIHDVYPSCATLNNHATGTYYVRPFGATEPFLVRCDFEDNFNLGGGWTVFQHRYNGSVGFARHWPFYKDGFGEVDGEHWLGLEKLHVMTRSARHELMVILEDFDGNTAYAHYDNFQIGNDAEDYKLTVGNYSGTAGDSLQQHDGMRFSTFDRDNDVGSGHCGGKYRGGWWYNDCLSSNLNGVYYSKDQHVRHDPRVLVWENWRGCTYSLKSSKMMLRRRFG